jgi:hypothetical protein
LRENYKLKEKEKVKEEKLKEEGSKGGNRKN